MSTTPARKPQPPLDADAWIDEALEVLAAGGVDAVRVDPLAKRLGVTRGSFYWHFKDRDALHHAMLRRWRTRANYNVFSRVEGSSASAGERLALLLALPYSSPRSAKAAAIELAIRLWARRDREAAKAVRHIDRVRLRYFSKLLVEHGLEKAEARRRAFLFYAALMAEAFILSDSSTDLRADLSAMLLAPQ